MLPNNEVWLVDRCCKDLWCFVSKWHEYFIKFTEVSSEHTKGVIINTLSELCLGKKITLLLSSIQWMRT